MALLLFGPFLGLRLGDNEAGNLTLSTRPGLLAAAVALTFAARFLMLLWYERRPRRVLPLKLSAGAAQSARYLGPALLVAAVAMPLLPGIENSYIDLGVLIMTYVMLGWGLNIVVGLAGLLDLGYVAFYAVGSYSFALLAENFGLGFWECLPLSGLLAALWGMCLGFPVLRLRGDKNLRDTQLIKSNKCVLSKSNTAEGAGIPRSVFTGSKRDNKVRVHIHGDNRIFQKYIVQWENNSTTQKNLGEYIPATPLEI